MYLKGYNGKLFLYDYITRRALAHYIASLHICMLTLEIAFNQKLRSALCRIRRSGTTDRIPIYDAFPWFSNEQSVGKQHIQVYLCLASWPPVSWVDCWDWSVAFIPSWHSWCISPSWWKFCSRFWCTLVLLFPQILVLSPAVGDCNFAINKPGSFSLNVVHTRAVPAKFNKRDPHR